jgi:hypothetical protein
MFLLCLAEQNVPSALAEQNVPSVLGGTVSRDSVGVLVLVVPISPRVVRWYMAATGDGWIVTAHLKAIGKEREGKCFSNYRAL